MATCAIRLGNGGMALVDEADYERVSRYTWTLDKNGYVVRKDGKRKLLLHRFILDAPPGYDVDHINHDRLDNRRANLRLATRSQNNANSGPRPGASRFKGVSRHEGAWRAEICVNGKRRRLGRYRNEIAAAKAYDRAAWAAWGEFAYLNFPQELRGERRP
ncbi:MAG TPA: HNH endonuclease signature motif containing protein [Caldilineaceae bacterium]|nr:HNH endonuclease signature motif containing protein [Caldilineaceae bacterium]